MQGRCDILAPHGPSTATDRFTCLCMWSAALRVMWAHLWRSCLPLLGRRIAVQVITVQATVLERFAPPFQNTNLRCSHTAAAAAASLRFIGASQRIGNRSVCAVGGRGVLSAGVFGVPGRRAVRREAQPSHRETGLVGNRRRYAVHELLNRRQVRGKH